MDKHKRGQLVRTVPDGRRDFTTEAQKKRKFGTGHVIQYSNCHGLCYEVLLSDGTLAWFDHDELYALPMKFWDKVLMYWDNLLL